MKIALVNKAVSLSHGGLERFTVNLAGSLQREGHEVHVFAQRAEDLPAAVVVHPVEARRKPAFRRLLAFAAAVDRQLAAERFDVIYGLTHMLNPDIYRMGDGVQRHWMRIRYPWAPWRWLNYLVNPAHLVHLYLERRIYHGQARIVTNSQLCSDQVRHYYGVAAERVRVVYNGVDHRVFNPEAVGGHRERLRRELGVQPGDILLLHVSNNWFRKGLAVTIDALAQLGEAGRHCHLAVVGRGRPDPFRQRARRLGVGERIHFCGTTPRVSEFYGAADLLVLPTLYDPFSNVCLEAMACARAVVTTRGNGAAELVTPGIHGFIQEDPRSVEELTRLLQACLQPGKLRQMGEAAQRVALDHTLERNLEETLAVFHRLVENRG